MYNEPIPRAQRVAASLLLGAGLILELPGAAAPAVAGLIATAGNLVIAGKNNGDLVVLDAKTGAPLYQRHLNAGAIDGGLTTL